MFKEPAWEKDTPLVEVNFGKKINNKQKTSTKNTEAAKKDTNRVNKIHANGVNKVFAIKHENKGKYLNSYQHYTESVHSPKVPNSTKFTSKHDISNSTNRTQTKRHNLNGKILKINKNKLTNSLKLKNSATNILKSVENESKLELNSPQVTKTNTNTSVNGINKAKCKKVKHDASTVATKKKKDLDFDGTSTFGVPNFDNNLLDEVIINTKKKKLNEDLKHDDKEYVLLGEKINIKSMKKQRIMQLLQNGNRNTIKTSGNKLRERMMERLKAAQFRYLNEKLYTSSGSDAQRLFQNDPVAFQTYHEGYQQQVKKWPVNPIDVIVKRIQKMPKSYTIADMGCGEAALSRRVPHSVRSFDLVAGVPGVEACDMAHCPLLAASVDVTVYCLALMGTDLTQYLLEANRVLRMGGHLLIAEVESRFDKVENFTKEVERLGFKLKNLDKSNKVFIFTEFTKIRDSPVKKSKLPALSLKPCLYKKR